MIGIPLLERVAAWVARAEAPIAGEAVVVGCSGGGDSTALLAALAALGLGPLHAVYVDHGLRAGTDGEAAVVAVSAAAAGASFERVAVVVERRGNLLAAAREARYRALIDAAHRRGARWVAVGHTATDQAETVVFHAARGDVCHALAGMPPRRALDAEVTLLRPLLDVTRAETAAFATERGYAIVQDPTNERADLTRTRIRRALAKRTGEDLDHRLAALATATADWVVRLDEQAGALGALDDLDARAVAGAGLDVALRLLRRAGLVDAGRAHANALLVLAASTAGSRTIDLGGGLVAERSYARLRLGSAGPGDPGDVELSVPGPGNYELLGRIVTITIAAVAVPPWPWLLRNQRPGDRFRTRAGRRKLSDLYIDHKLPVSERRRTPVLEVAGELYWVAGLGTAYHPAGGVRMATIRCALSPSGNGPSVAKDGRLTPPGRVQ